MTHPGPAATPPPPPETRLDGLWSMPAAYMVTTPGVTTALFLDHGRAQAYAAKYGGQVVPLYMRP